MLFSLLWFVGQTGVPHQWLHGWRGPGPRLHAQQKDPKRTVGSVQLHPRSVKTQLFFLLVFLSTLRWRSFFSSCLTLPGTVVGEKEKTSNTVNVRTRDNKVHGECSVEECIQRLTRLKASRSRNAEEEFWVSSTSRRRSGQLLVRDGDASNVLADSLSKTNLSFLFYFFCLPKSIFLTV